MEVTKVHHIPSCKQDIQPVNIMLDRVPSPAHNPCVSLSFDLILVFIFVDLRSCNCMLHTKNAMMKNNNGQIYIIE